MAHGDELVALQHVTAEYSERVSDPSYSLAWPRELFVWEADRILALSGDVELTNGIATLLREAFADADVEAEFQRQTNAGALSDVWDAKTADSITTSATDWLQAVLNRANDLQPYQSPVYFAQRAGLTEPTEQSQATLADAVVYLIKEMQYLGYFPKILPPACVDDGGISAEWLDTQIASAIGHRIQWPLDSHSPQLRVSEPILFSLIEFFHDHAQRPRTSWWHSFNECGFHYQQYNRESGGVVYRWRMNEVLAAHGSMFRIAREGAQRGRLVRTFSAALDTTLEQVVVERREGSPEDEVANAIELFRSRDATAPTKRAALTVLANHLEPRRVRIRAATTKNDEVYLFDIANNFAIRHRNDHQRQDYGPEYLDWLFVNYLGMIQLIDSLDSREGQPSRRV